VYAAPVTGASPALTAVTVDALARSFARGSSGPARS